MNLRDLVQECLRTNQLPQVIDVGDLKGGIDNLLRHSNSDGIEWGGCIVLQEGQLQVVHQVQGRQDGVDPRCKPEDHNNYVGFIHIHLPDQDGVSYLGFSAQDFAGTLADGDNVALVCNGSDVFVLVRTADHTQPRRTPSRSERQRWGQLYNDLIEQAKRQMALDPAAQQGSDALDRALWQANKRMCQELGFAFYRGPWCQPLSLVFRP